MNLLGLAACVSVVLAFLMALDVMAFSWLTLFMPFIIAGGALVAIFLVVLLALAVSSALAWAFGAGR